MRRPPLGHAHSTRARLLGAVLLSLAACGRDGGPDHVLHGGTIRTLNERDDVAEAIALRDGTIVAIGTSSEILPLATGRTEVRDLDGRTVLPGFVGAHEHPTLSAVFGGVVDVSGFERATSEEVWEALRAGVAGAAPGDWVYAMGIDPILVPDLEMPSRERLDAIAPENPLVVVSQTMHSFWANSRAFDAAGIDGNTPDPGHGSHYERDAQGNLTGFVAEVVAAKPLLAELQSPWRLATRYEEVLDDLLEAGFTSVASLGMNVPPLLARFAASENLEPRIRQFFYLAPDERGSLPEHPDRSHPFFRILGVKIWHDGSPTTGSMFLETPYLDSPLARRLGIPRGGRGAPIVSDEALDSEIASAEEAGWQVAIHSHGDASSREVVRAFARAAEPRAGALPRRMEHCGLIPVDLLPELARLGVSPSFHINHLYYYGDALADSILGAERADRLLPVRSAFELGLSPTLHADSPMFPAEPLSLVRTAVLRRTRSGRSIGAGEAIRIDQALRAVTLNAARQLGMESEIGSLEVGKAADLVVLDADPVAVRAEDLDEIDVIGVYVAGRRRDLRSR